VSVHKVPDGAGGHAWVSVRVGLAHVPPLQTKSVHVRLCTSVVVHDAVG
jgi:hypothetical protein